MYKAYVENLLLKETEDIKEAILAIDKDARRCFCFLSCAKAVEKDGKIVRYDFLDRNSHPSRYYIEVA